MVEIRTPNLHGRLIEEDKVPASRRGCLQSDGHGSVRPPALEPARTTFLEHQFAAIERLGVMLTALDAAQAHQPAKKILGKPMLGSLGREMFQ